MELDQDGRVFALDARGRGLRSLPDFLLDGRLGLSLRQLRLSRNALDTLPPELFTAASGLIELCAADNELGVLPDSLGEARALEVLGLASNQLTALPASLGELAALRTLRLSDNALTELPAAIGGCGALAELSVARNRLHALPDALAQCPLVALNVSANALVWLPKALPVSLRTLQLADNRLTELPTTFGDLRALETLNLSGNRLRALPHSFGKLVALVTLGLGANRLQALPAELGGLGALRTLQLGENRLTELPESLGACIALEDLGLAQNALCSLPDSLGKLTALRALVLAQARLVRLPADIARLATLQQLELSGSKLEALPPEVCGLRALRSLRASDCRLAALPDALGALSALQVLRVDGNALGELPDSLGGLCRLGELWAGGNTLVALPPSIGELGELAVLSLTSNRLVALPVELCACARLERLLLDDNRLASLPDGLHALRACVELGLSANLLHAVPHSLPPHLEILRLNSNSLEEAPVWERVPRETFLFDNPCAAPRSAGRRPLVAVLLPGLVRSYAHGAHWRAFFARYAEAYDLRAFLYVWPIRGAVANNFSQEADRAAGEPLDVHRLEESYPEGTVIELADMAEWVREDAEGFDGRFYNQWAMLARCHALMRRSLADERPDFVIRGRPDLRAACIPRPLETCGVPYLAMQDYLWGSDAFFYGDDTTMTSMCALADHYEEYTRQLGYASSEPMMEKYIKDRGHRLVHFSRCFCIDRSDG
mmetsp:Transcript_25309/g.76774  ORF Transcript_25309/g.76774 Transcript_25309/m.76774 type:complete len:726 (-) Transcript_25309:253-2430(-)